MDKTFLSVNEHLKNHYAGEPTDWDGSPFEWIKEQPSRRVGAIGEILVAEWFGAKGYEVHRAGNSDFDRLINNTKLEVKFSTLWKNGTYRFQQIRDQNYDLAFCLGLSPFSIHAWLVPKQVLWQNTSPQHGGAAGSDTHWLQVDPLKIPFWLTQFGGSLEEVEQLAYKLIR